MTKQSEFKHEFVEFIPDTIESGKIYISIPYATGVHNCACGCGNQVITPITPTDWKLIFDGETISLDPSIGNWSFACQSHYWIRRNKVMWAGKWTAQEIAAGREHDQYAKKMQFDEQLLSTKSASLTQKSIPAKKLSFLEKVKSFFS